MHLANGLWAAVSRFALGQAGIRIWAPSLHRASAPVSTSPGSSRSSSAAEGAPKSARLTQQEAKVQGKLSALGTLRAALAKFQDTVAALKSLDKFQGRQAALSVGGFPDCDD